ncbi:cytochrome P460 family protein [Roseibium sp. HPY-6]|uniref:cytochrome P460 family protein n=1 Tax=Roseibium sp. HPY-6 TaxID=3229852 RepID=UPI00338FB9AB
MQSRLVSLGSFAVALLMSSTAYAACDVQKSGDELTADEAQSIYDCLKSDLQTGYQNGPKRWIPADFVKDYPNWTQASAFPAAPGFHGGRFLMTYVNSIGADEYLKYKAENVTVPAGTRIAKESFSVDGDGKVSKGPLFLMEKVAGGKSPDTGDWYYMMVSPNGSPQAVNVITACSECHLENFGEQGGLGYPVEDARIK